MKRPNSTVRSLEDRRILAEEKKSDRAARSTKDQIAILDARLGVNTGALKERSRLDKLLSISKNTEKKKKQPNLEKKEKKKTRAKDLRSQKREKTRT